MIEYIEYTRGGQTFLETLDTETGTYERFGPYTPKPGYCPRCRSPRHHTVSGLATCTTCHHQWPNPQQTRPGEVARIHMEEP